MAFGAGGGRRRQRFSAFMATFFPCFLTQLLKMKGEAADGAVEPSGGGDRGGGGGRGSEVRAGPGGAEAAGDGEARGGCASPAGRPDTLSRRGAGERAGSLGVGDRCLRHSD